VTARQRRVARLLALWWSARMSIAVGWTVVVLVILWSPPPPPPEVTIPYYDKYFHFALFVGIGVTWRAAGLGGVSTFVGGVLLGVLTEVVQAVLPWPRTPDGWDVAADAAGLGAAAGISALIGRAWRAAQRDTHGQTHGQTHGHAARPGDPVPDSHPASPP
jgi:hypothetical protein